MKDYELTYLVKLEITEEEIKSLLEKISDLIKAHEGIIKKTTEPSKKNLGYQIKEKSEAFLVSIEFSLNPDKLKQLEDSLKEEKRILRHIIVIKEKLKEVVKTIKPLEPISAKPEKKADLEDIDEKIEEMLK